MTRNTAYAGSFYDASPDVIRKQFDKWFARAVLPTGITNVRGVICPHAGFVYSGACAAHSYKLLSQQKFKTAIILHPSHRGNHFGFSVSPFTTYKTPLGELLLDIDIANILINNGSQQIDASYHQTEHSMEVQLPFLTYINPKVKIVPVMIGNQTNEVSLELAEILSEVISKQPNDIVVIVSTDLSHYHTSEEAEQMDKSLIEYVINNDIPEFYHNIMHGKIEACGFAGIMSLLYLAKHYQDEKIIELNYTHSGYVSKDFEQVVGYLSAALVSTD